MVFRHPHPQRAAAAPRVGMVGVDSLDLSAHLFWPNLIRSRSMMGSTTLEDKNAGRLKMMVVGRSNGPLLEKAEKGRTRRRFGIDNAELYFACGEVAHPPSSENAGAQSGAQNVIGIDASGTATNHIDPNNFGRSYDKGVWDFSSVTSGQLAPHEFSHVLGLDDNHGNVLSNSFSSASMGTHPHATAQDYQWAFGSELKAGKTRFNVGDYEGKTLFTGVNRGNRHWWEGWTNPQVDHK